MDYGGHRERVKQRFAEQGLNGFSEETALEMLLFYVIPRRDTTPIARALLDRFGALVDVLDAPVEELAKIEGMGVNSAQYLHFLMAVYRYYFSQRSREDVVLDTVEKCGEYLAPRFLGRQEEAVFLLCLNGQCNPVGCKEISTGDICSASIPVRRIVEYALGVGATSVILAHNHPNGMALPSPQDVLATRRVAEALSTVEINLVDHLVMTHEDFTSMAESGMLQGVGTRSRGQREMAAPGWSYGSPRW